jgi:hypothetical protein
MQGRSGAEFAGVGKVRFGAILADPPWRFQNSTGKVAPEHKRLNRYGTMHLDEICALPVSSVAGPTCSNRVRTTAPRGGTGRSREY